MMLQRRIDDVLESVRLADLLAEERVVRERIGLGGAAPRPPEPRGLPVLQS
jgi:hypothetical protein